MKINSLSHTGMYKIVLPNVKHPYYVEARSKEDARAFVKRVLKNKRERSQKTSRILRELNNEMP